MFDMDMKKKVFYLKKIVLIHILTHAFTKCRTLLGFLRLAITPKYVHFKTIPLGGSLSLEIVSETGRKFLILKDSIMHNKSKRQKYANFEKDI